MMYSLEIYGYFFSSFYLGIYVFAAVLLLITTTFLKGIYQKESYNFLYVFNTLVAWCSFYGFAYSVGELFIAWYGQNPYEWYSFKRGVNTYSNMGYFIRIYLPFLLGMLFFLRKLRISRFFSMLFLFFLNFERIEVLVSSIFEDYLPSSWSINYVEQWTDKVMKYFFIIFLLMLVYIIANKRKKLPYPSVFLK